MAFFDYLWIVRLIIEILKIIAAMPEPERQELANLQSILPDFSTPTAKQTRRRKTPGPNENNPDTT